MGFQTAKHPKKTESSKMIATFNQKFQACFEHHSLSRKNIFRNEASKIYTFQIKQKSLFCPGHSSTRISHTYQRKKPSNIWLHKKKPAGITPPKKSLGGLLTCFFPPVNPVKKNNKTPLNLGKRHNQKKQGSLQKEIVGPHWRCFLPHHQRWVSFKPSVFLVCVRSKKPFPLDSLRWRCLPSWAPASRWCLC